MRALLVLALLTGVAYADTKGDPWEEGVSEEQQDKANALFREANALFAEKAHPAALDKYRAAVALWDHPMIRFNMAVTLIRLDQYLEAAEQLEKALRYGATPFTPELYEQALDYQALVTKQLGYIDVTCTEPGTHITLDGKPLFDAPGTKQIRTTSGEHSIVAEKKGFMTVSRSLVIVGGSTVKESVQMMPVESALVIEYTRPRWMPWTLTGVGAALAAGGIGLVIAGNRQMDRFSSSFVRDCPAGCQTTMFSQTSLADEQDSAILKSQIGVSLIVTGGVAVVGGIVWGITNRHTRTIGPHVEVAPTASGASASASWRF